MGVPVQLPIIPQVVGARKYRGWGLKLLSKYLDLGPWAVAEALSLRIVPQMVKLLQKPTADTQEHLVFIWTKLLAYDRGLLQRDLLKGDSVEFFIRAFTDPSLSEPTRVMAGFVLSAIMAGHPSGQRACHTRHLLSRAVASAASAGATVVVVASKGTEGGGEAAGLPPLLRQSPMLMQWYAFAFSKLWEGYNEPRASDECPGALKVIKHFIVSPFPDVRAAAVYACGTFFNPCVAASTAQQGAAAERTKEWEINLITSFQVGDPSPAVRKELVYTLSRFAECHISDLAAYVQQEEALEEDCSVVVVPSTSTGSGSSPPVVQLQYPSPVLSMQQQQQQAQQQQQSQNQMKQMQRPPSAYFRKTPLLIPGARSKKHASVYLWQSPAGTSAPVTRSSSSASSSSAASALYPAQDASFYQFLWNALAGLAEDPQPEVAALAEDVMAAVRNYSDLHARYAQNEESLNEYMAESLPAQPSEKARRSILQHKESQQQLYNELRSTTIALSSTLYERSCEYWRAPIADRAEEDHSSPEYKSRERRYRNSVCVYNSAREAWKAWNSAEKKDLSAQLPSLESKPDITTASVFFPFESILVCATDAQTIKYT